MKKYGILLQGKISEWTKDIVKEYRMNFPDTDILVSTWDNEDTSMIPCRVIKTKLPKLSGIHSSSVDFQIIGTQKGLQNINAEIIMKCRTDQFIHNRHIFLIYEKFCDKEKIMVPDQGTSTLDDYRVSDFCQVASKKKIEEFWKKKVKLNQKNFEINEYVQLPSIIFSENDLAVIHHYIAEPNYITKKKIISNTILLDDLKQITNIESNIVLIENADPGFDWIFAKNPSGLVTKYGGIASHMAIRCAELGLPAAIGCGEILFNKLKMSSKINLNCKDKDILILEYNLKKNYFEEKKLLKSLGYIR